MKKSSIIGRKFILLTLIVQLIILASCKKPQVIPVVTPVVPPIITESNITYYVNAETGIDANSGTSTTSAWKTINRVNTQKLGPGDKVLFNSDGAWHNGKIVLDVNDVGSPTNPIVIDTYGIKAKAVIYGGDTDAFYSVIAGVKIQNLAFYGARMLAGSNNGYGINFYKEGTANYSAYIFIDNCQLEGFGKAGIFIWSDNDNANRQRGFSDVTIKNTTANNCGNAGVQIYAYGSNAYKHTVHSNVLIDNVRTSNNAGTSTITAYATGNGIVVSSATNVIIQNCVADKNGKNNAHIGAGIAAIWFYDVNNGIIQNCEAFENYGSQETDGNGFGIDGGCQNCIIQYCYSHDNEGGGYGLFEFGSLNEHQNNTIRYNISQNDARKNGVGAFSIWANNNTTDRIINANIYNNTVYLDAKNLIPTTNIIGSNGIGSIILPTGIRYLQAVAGSLINVKFYNNIFYLDDANINLPFVKTEDYSLISVNTLPANLLLQNNLYYKATNPKFLWGNTHTSLSAWRTATNQEKIGGSGSDSGIITDPVLVNPGKGGTIAGAITGLNPVIVPLPNTGTGLNTLTAYKLKTSSTAIGAGLRLNIAPYSIIIGTKDFYGNNLSATTLFDIGAFQTN